MKPADPISQLFNKEKSATFKKGHLFYEPDDDIDQIYFLNNGIVRQYTVSSDGQETTLHLYRPDSYFPILIAISGVTNRFYFEAMNDCACRLVPTKHVITYLKAHPGETYDLLHRATLALDGLTKRIELSLTSSAKDKVASLISYLALNFGHLTKSGYELNTQVSHEYFSSWLGLTRETISRQISTLKKAGLISTSKNRIIIPNLSALEKPKS